VHSGLLDWLTLRESRGSLTFFQAVARGVRAGFSEPERRRTEHRSLCGRLLGTEEARNTNFFKRRLDRSALQAALSSARESRPAFRPRSRNQEARLVSP
jgi:hypothetical protein